MLSIRVVRARVGIAVVSALKYKVSLDDLSHLALTLHQESQVAKWMELWYWRRTPCWNFVGSLVRSCYEKVSASGEGQGIR